MFKTSKIKEMRKVQLLLIDLQIVKRILYDMDIFVCKILVIYIYVLYYVYFYNLYMFIKIEKY